MGGGEDDRCIYRCDIDVCYVCGLVSSKWRGVIKGE